MTERRDNAAPGSNGLRIGQGYDCHRLAHGGRPMVIGGIPFDSPVGPIAHSDGDALMHAITDAILGALGLPDIGQLFPDTDARWQGAPSEAFLSEARRMAAQEGWTVGNLDATVIVQSPKIGPRKDDLRRNLARILGVDPSRVNIKGKTHELAEASRPDDRIEAFAAVLMTRA